MRYRVNLTDLEFGIIMSGRHEGGHFRLYTLGFEHVGHLDHLHVGHHVSHHVSHHVGHRNVVSSLCEGSETLTKWKSESVTDDGLTDRLTGVARYTCMSKNKVVYEGKTWRVGMKGQR